MAAERHGPTWQQQLQPLDGGISANQEQSSLLPTCTSPSTTTPRVAQAATATPTRPPPHRPSTSPMLHTSHAMILQLREYRERVQSACQSTYQFALQAPRKPAAAAARDDDTPRRATKGYCRAHVLASSKQFFHAREPSPVSHSPGPVGHGKDRVLPRQSGAHVNFHQMTARRDEFLFGDHTGTASRRPQVALDGDRAVGVAKDHFALGPGQYDVRPRTGTSVKFSPSDRFHDDFSTAQLGPGQYITSDELTTPRTAAAVFSQTPRRTEVSLLVSPTANTVSSYYYVPASSFREKNAPQNNHPSWPRSPRLSSQRRTTASVEAHKLRVESNTTDYIEKNRTALEAQRAVQRMRAARALQGRLQANKQRQRRQRHDRYGATGDSSNEDSDDSDSGTASAGRAPATRFKRRSSIFLDIGAPVDLQQQQQQIRGAITSSKASQALVQRPSGGGSSHRIAGVTLGGPTPVSVAANRATRGLIALASIATFSARLARRFHLATIVRRIERAERQHMQRVVLSAWRELDHARAVQHAAHVILASSFRLRVALRIRRKCAHVGVLRQFLGGLSVDVQFALAMKKIKRKIQLLQRWWRHVQLMVRAREEALYHKWLNVETRLRLEYINQMPHLQRIFQPPAAAVAGAYPSGSSASLSGSPMSSAMATAATSSRDSDTTLQRLLNLPEQRKWFTAHFVLTSDGCLRGYSDDAGDAKAVVVEMKHFRCHFHEGVADASDSEFALLLDGLGGGGTGGGGGGSELSRSPSLQAAYTGYSNARWKPFVMVFRQGAFRFVLLTSPSPMPTEILAWKDKLERLAVTGGGGSGAAFGSLSGVGGGSDALLGVHHRASVGDFVEMSMQSGILAPATSSGSTHSSFSSLAMLASPGGASSSSSNSLSGLGSLLAASGSSRNVVGAAPRGKLQARVRSLRQRNRMGVAVTEGELSYYVVDLLKDFPKVPPAVVWQTIREKLREKRKSFRAELYRYNLELFHFHRHQEQTEHIRVLDKFREFFTLERPKRPHFRSLVSNRKMEVLIRQVRT